MRSQKIRLGSIERLAVGLLVSLAALFVPGCGRTPANGAADIRRNATVEVVEKVNPSVVNIATSAIVERVNDPQLRLLRDFFGWRVQGERREELYAIGSGV